MIPGKTTNGERGELHVVDYTVDTEYLAYCWNDYENVNSPHVTNIVEDRTRLLDRVSAVGFSDKHVVVNCVGNRMPYTLLSESYSEGDGVTPGGGKPVVRLTTDADEIFNAGDTIMVQGVNGYEADGTSPSDAFLMLRVDSMSISGGLKVYAINGHTYNGVPNCIPNLEEGVTLVRLGTSFSDAQLSIYSYNHMPGQMSDSYMQHFSQRVSWSDAALVDVPAGKFTFDDAVSAGRTDFLNSIEMSYLFGAGGKATDSSGSRVNLCRGLYWQAKKQYDFTSLDAEHIIDLGREYFENNMKVPVATLLCGLRMWKLIVSVIGSDAIIDEDGNKFMSTPYGRLRILLAPLFDCAGMSECGLIVDLNQLIEYVYRGYSENYVADGNVHEMTFDKISCMVASNPYSMMRVVRR